VDYVGDTTFVQSMLTILRHRDITAELLVLPAMHTAGAHRRELAVAARGAIAGVLETTAEVV
jgi:1-acyl-sn-glycerol-3-phosphate acyltransferase